MRPEQYRKLAEAGLSHEQIAVVMELMEADAEERRAKGRERWHRHNAKKQGLTLANVSKRLQPTNARAEDSSSKEEITGKDKKEEGTPLASSPKKRASRLSSDWVIPEEWVLEAIAAGLTRSQALASASTMKNWSLSSTQGAKLDWLATWRNWFAREAKQQHAGAPPQQNRRQGAFDALRSLQQKGLIPADEPEQLHGTNGNAQRFPTEPSGGHGGVVVNLQRSAFRRIGPGD